MASRSSIARRCSRRPGPLIVDEAYAELRFDGKTPRPLLADAPDRVWHVGTISKTLAPGLRVGWLIPPAATRDRARAQGRRRSADRERVAGGARAARRDRRLRRDARARPHRVRRTRRRAVRRASSRRAGLQFREPEGGFSIWIETEARATSSRCSRAGLDAGVMFDPGSAFRPEPARSIALRASYSNAAARPARRGRARLAKVLARS